MHENPYLMKGEMKKPMLTMLVGMAVFLLMVAGYQAFKGMMINKYMIKNTPTEVEVSSIKAQMQPWQPHIIASGSVLAIQGVDVTTQISGQVQLIYFEAGSVVKKGDELLKLSDSTEMAKLQSLKAQAEIARITYERDREQLKVEAISQQTVDSDFYNLQNLKAQVDEQQSVVNKKLIVAPFSGTLGIREVNLGQFLNPGDKIVSLQSLDPIFVNFYLPQQQMKHMELGQIVHITCDAYPNQMFDGKVTAFNPNADQSTRNIQIQATIPNPKQQLLPGMYTTVEVDTGRTQPFITLPQTSINYNSYGSFVYVVKPAKPKEDAKKKKRTPATQPGLVVEQTFVVVGETRGDQIAIVKGVNENDEVVTSGQVKIKNGSAVKINNTTVPADSAAPVAKDG